MPRSRRLTLPPIRSRRRLRQQCAITEAKECSCIAFGAVSDEIFVWSNVYCRSICERNLWLPERALVSFSFRFIFRICSIQSSIPYSLSALSAILGSCWLLLAFSKYFRRTARSAHGIIRVSVVFLHSKIINPIGIHNEKVCTPVAFARCRPGILRQLLLGLGLGPGTGTAVYRSTD